MYMSSLSTNLTHLYMTYGVILGLGASLVYAPSLVMARTLEMPPNQGSHHTSCISESNWWTGSSCTFLLWPTVSRQSKRVEYRTDTSILRQILSKKILDPRIGNRHPLYK